MYRKVNGKGTKSKLQKKGDNQSEYTRQHSNNQSNELEQEQSKIGYKVINRSLLQHIEFEKFEKLKFLL